MLDIFCKFEKNLKTSLKLN